MCKPKDFYIPYSSKHKIANRDFEACGDVLWCALNVREKTY